MRVNRHFAMLPALLIALLPSCNSADFGGSSSQKALSADNECDQSQANCSNTPDPPPPANCVDGDKVAVQWRGPVKECLIDEGKTYNFELKKCAEMRRSKFECNWENVTRELEERGLLTDVLKEDSQNGSKLVSCGQSADGNRIVVQWISTSDGTLDCSKAASGADITTGCYTLYGPDDSRPGEARSPEERRAQVYDCMNKL